MAHSAERYALACAIAEAKAACDQRWRIYADSSQVIICAPTSRSLRNLRGKFYHLHFRTEHLFMMMTKSQLNRFFSHFNLEKDYSDNSILELKKLLLLGILINETDVVIFSKAETSENIFKHYKLK